MLEVYFGTDTLAARSAAHKKLKAAEIKGVVVSVIESDNYQTGVLKDAVGATSLFGEAMAFLIDSPRGVKGLEEEVFEQLAALAESEHLFVVIEGSLLAADKKPYAKYAQTMEEFKATAAERFNVFALADSLASKNKKLLWLQLQQAVRAGLSAEEIIGTLWWQLKSLRLAALTTSAKVAGMKDYPYNKAKRYVNNFKPSELEAIATSLLAVYHDGHSGKRDIDAALEKWVLGL